MYSSYTAASVAREFELAARHGINLQASLTWAFEFEDQPLFAGFRQLASNGIDLPVLNVFRMFSCLQGRRVRASSSGQAALDDILAGGVRAAPDVGVIATRGDGQLAVLVWHYHDDDIAGPVANVALTIAGLPRNFTKVSHYRIDGEHSNAYAAWQRLGAPASVDQAVYAALREAGQLAQLTDPGASTRTGGKWRLEFPLPRQAVSLLVFSEAR
jgi:xylan 1,4-beta-xylosidase